MRENRRSQKSHGRRNHSCGCGCGDGGRAHRHGCDCGDREVAEHVGCEDRAEGLGCCRWICHLRVRHAYVCHPGDRVCGDRTLRDGGDYRRGGRCYAHVRFDLDGRSPSEMGHDPDCGPVGELLACHVFSVCRADHVALFYCYECAGRQEGYICFLGNNRPCQGICACHCMMMGSFFPHILATTDLLCSCTADSLGRAGG